MTLTYPPPPKQAKQLLIEAGHANRFDGGDITPNPPYFSMAEAVSNGLAAVGMERAVFLTAWRQKKLRGIILGAQGAGGNATTRIEGLATRGGMFAYGVLPEVEDLFQRQARSSTGRSARSSSITLIPAFPYSASYEDLQLKRPCRPATGPSRRRASGRGRPERRACRRRRPSPPTAPPSPPPA